ncbi:beta family protein [Occultella kanbiaonis]|uniref:beta family protein n=1 Tax=Occultella kanbiaonis TaxID=2675754 RepID=UPI0012B79CD7|nr:beta family protein [Occultella kanbiaonis]
MDAISSGHYVPILLAKQGERGALTALSGHVRSALTPILVVAPIDWNFDADAPKRDVNEHVQKVPDQILKAWGTQDAFIDLVFLPDGAMDTGQHALVWLTERAAASGLALTPVVSPDRTDEYLQAARDVVARDMSDLCVRLAIDEWPTIAGDSAVDDLLASFSLGPERVHLVLDLGEDLGPAALAAITGELRTIRHLDRWKSLIVAGAGMPKTMPPGKGAHTLPRRDWLLYGELRGALAAGARVPTFGDYGIASPDPTSDVDPKFMNISATLRYTTDDAWLIARGGLFKGNGGKSLGAEAVPPVCRLLLAQPAYMGVDHCDLEKWVEEVAVSDKGGGGAAKWRDYGTRHHLQVVTDQLASLVGP